MDSNQVRYVEWIFVRNNPYRNGFCFGSVPGTEQNFKKIEKIEKYFLKYLRNIFFSRWLSVPNSVLKRGFLTNFRATFRTNKNSVPKSVLRTVPISFVPKFVPRTEPNKISYQKSVPRTVPYQLVPTVRPFRAPIVAMRFISIKSQLADLKPCRHICSIWMPFFVVDSVLI